MRKVIHTKFDFGETVVLKTEPEIKRLISGFLIRQKSITYGVVKGEDESWHSEIELMSCGKPFKVKGFVK